MRSSTTCRRPLDVPPPVGAPTSRTGERMERKATDDAPFSALAFKIMSDPYVGKLTYFRVYSGQARHRQRGSQRHQGSQGARRPHPPDARQPPRGHGRRASPATSSPRSASSRPTTGDTLCDPAHPILGEDGVPRAGDLGGDRAEDQGRPGQARQGAGCTLRGGPHLPRPLR